MTESVFDTLAEERTAPQPATPLVEHKQEENNEMTVSEKIKTIAPEGPEAEDTRESFEGIAGGSVEVVPDKKSFLAKAKAHVREHKVGYGSLAVVSVGAGAGAGYMLKTYGYKKSLSMASYYSRKYLPAGLAITGTVGLIATAFLAYKAAPEVEKRLDWIEDQRLEGKKISSLQAAKMIAGPLWKPIALGTGSVGAIAGSFLIMNGRVSALSKIARQQAKALQEGTNPYTTEEQTNADGEVEQIKVHVKPQNNDLLGRWFQYSEEATSDDMEYNIRFIDNAERVLQDSLFEKGVLTMNHVLEVLGFEKTREGAVIGWTTADSFFLDKRMFKAQEESSDTESDEIFVQWTPAHSVYDQVSFTGRYSE